MEPTPSASRTAPASGEGRLPTFLIIGAMKAGTTSLAMWLRAHPDVFIPREKETHFFDVHHERGLDWYRARFAEAGHRRAVGEATPGYMFKEDAFSRMAGAVPDARLMAVLRNPVDRAYSHYWHRRTNARESREFGEAVAAEIAADPAEGRRWGGYLARGRYLEQLERVTERYARDALSVFLFEDLRDAQHETFAAACRFLDIDETVRPSSVGVVYTRTRPEVSRLDGALDRYDRWIPKPLGRALRARGRRPAAYPPLDPATRAILVAYFRPFNEALGRWLGRDLAAWDG